MATLDPRVEAIRVKYDLAKDDFWELPQKKGTWIAKHAALEVAAAKAKIVFLSPQVLEANGETKSVALCVTGTTDDRSEWSIGEASPANNRNAYPYAMAEKRGKDRVILKLIGLHGLIYSEDEADDFKRPANGTTPSQAQVIHSSPTMPKDPDIEEGVKNWCEQQKNKIRAAEHLPDLYAWLDDADAALDRLRRKAPEAHSELTQFYQAKFNEISKKETK